MGTEKKKILIFGSGISGLTIAHELSKHNLFDITVYEKDSIPGGMAKTRSEVPDNVPSEHSWRGWGNFYGNTFNIMKQIKNGDNSTVYDNLTKEVDFYILNNNSYKKTGDVKFSMSDYFILSSDILEYILSDKRREYFYSLNASEYYKGKLSEEVYDYMLKFVQTAGFGMENKDGSVGHLLRFIVLPYTHPFKYKNCNKEGKNCYKSTDKWHLLNQPTNKGWFEPWVKQLKEKGVNFEFNKELTKINIQDNNVKSVKVNGNQIEPYDEYILAINPFNLKEILSSSIPETKLYNNFEKLTDTTKSNQISFRIGIDKDIKYPTDYIGIVLTDSEYNITFYPQNTHWKKDVSTVYKTLYSGTLMDSVSNGKLYNKPSIELTKKQLEEEIKSQILNSLSFQKLIKDYNNGLTIKDKDIKYIEIWYEWKYDSRYNKLKQSYKKWVNNVYNEKYRPIQSTEYKNLFLSGAHTKTTAVIYSMEGATESGLTTANLILDKYNLPKSNIVLHTDPIWAKPFKSIDNILYNMNLDSVIYIVLTIILVIIIKLFKYTYNCK